MVEQSSAGVVGITVLSGLMLVFSFLFIQYGESNVSLLLLFAGLILAGILVFIVLMPKDSKNKLE
jgi:ABC-type Fe3+-siderophore transport system permease subunit